MTEGIEQIWSRVQSELAGRVDESTYRLWLAPLQARELSAGRLLVEAPPATCGWVDARFGRLIAATVSGVTGDDTRVEFLPRGVAHAVANAGARAPSPLQRQTDACDRAESTAHPPAWTPLGNPKLTFDQFVIGDCNRLAHAAALTVAEMPAQAYNPLFICGPPGVGKSHLLGAIASLVLSHNPGVAVRWTTGEGFTNEFLGALGAGHTESFKARFRDVDVLLLDDVQFLERKTRTEEEFFHTFNSLYDGGRQIVLTCDRPPRDLQALEDRLRERFQAGLVADIGPPELSTRIAILRKRVMHDHVELEDDEALLVLAERVRHNVRALEGALIRVVAYASMTGRALTCELVSEVLDKLHPQDRYSGSALRRSIADIQTAVCDHFGVSVQELTSTARAGRVAWPRQVAMYLAREFTDESLPAIGRGFGGRDHTTVLHAWRRTRARGAVDHVAREGVEKVCKALGLACPLWADSPDRGS